MELAPFVAIEGVNGETFTLSSDQPEGSLWLAQGAKGLDMLPWDIQVDQYPALDGEFPRAVRGSAREIFLPITIYGRTRPELVAAKRQLLRAFNPDRFLTSMAKVVVAEPAPEGGYEDEREIEVYYASGMEGDEGTDTNGLTWVRYGLVVRSTDPFFRDREDTVQQFFTFSSVSPFFPPDGEPFLSQDGVSGGFHLSAPPVPTNAITVVNHGDVRVYPVWTIQGPIPADTPFNLVREATPYNPQQVLQIVSLPLDEGETATIDTRPGQLLVSGSVGANVSWANLAVNPQFWTLDPGPNNVSIQQLPEGVLPTQLTISFRPKYLGM